MDKNEILIKEYEALRTEILDRSKREERAITWSLVFVSAFFSVKFFSENFNFLIGILPIFMFVFGMKWIENSFHTFKQGQYIRFKIENKLTHLNNMELIGWETFNARLNERKRNREFIVFPILYFAGIIFICWVFQIQNLVVNGISLTTCCMLVLDGLLLIFFITHWLVISQKRKAFLQKIGIL